MTNAGKSAALLLTLTLAAPLAARCAVVATEVPDDCGRSELSPMFKNGQAGLRSHHYVPLSRREARETVVLASGERIVMNHGGCESIVTTFHLESEQLLKSDASHLATYRAAAAMLRTLLRLHPETSLNLDQAANSIDAALRRKTLPAFEEQLTNLDGDNALATQVELDGAGRKGAIGYVDVGLLVGPL
jgi:hypothetical protein